MRYRRILNKQGPPDESVLCLMLALLEQERTVLGQFRILCRSHSLIFGSSLMLVRAVIPGYYDDNDLYSARRTKGFLSQSPDTSIIDS